MQVVVTKEELTALRHRAEHLEARGVTIKVNPSLLIHLIDHYGDSTDGYKAALERIVYLGISAPRDDSTCMMSVDVARAALAADHHP